MTHQLRLTSEKIGKRIDLIRPLIHKQTAPIAPFRMLRLDDAKVEPPIHADPTDWPEIPWYSHWGGNDTNFLLRGHFEVPEGWSGRLALYLPMGAAGDIFTHPESLLYIDGKPHASADRYHHTIDLPKDLAPGRHELALHGWTGLSGWPPDPNDRRLLYMRECAVVEIDTWLQRFVTEAEVALAAARHLPDNRLEQHGILNALDQAFLVLDTRDPLGPALYATVPSALRVLREGLKRAGQPIDTTLHGIGHAHIDIAYLWPISQTRRKNARTYTNVLRLMEKYPEFRFSHSQPALYQQTEEDYPEIFAGIQERVAAGQWEPMGGTWVESDMNMPGAEALVRQFLLGRRYYQEKFGAAETPILWLPDTFGFPWCLPQLAKDAGIKWFITNKLNWNQYNRMPSSTTWWQGIDGTQILTHFLTTPREVQHLPFPTNYKSDLSAEEVFGTWENAVTKRNITDLPICYGYGDGGGGPTDELIRMAQAWGNIPGAPKFKQSTARAFFEALEPQASELPVWNDELYLEGHRGVLTSQGWIKRANRKAEVLLHRTEFMQVLARLEGADPAQDLTKAWELLCLNQFHDIITGTSIAEVFEDAQADFAQIEEICAAAQDEALAAIAPAQPKVATHVAINANPGSGTRVAHLEGASGTVFHAETRDALPSQETEDGLLVVLDDLPAYAVTPLAFEPRGAAPAVQTSLKAELVGDGAVLENAFIRVEITAKGDLTRIYDKELGREVLAPGAVGNELQLFEDRPVSWDAWDIDAFFEDRLESLKGTGSAQLVETGPIRATVHVESKFRNSRIVQEISLHHHSKQIIFKTDVDWRESHILMKAAFPVDVHAQSATYDMQWGNIGRPTHRNTSWDYARFEVPVHKWVDLSEGDYGVALLNDCKYGCDVRENVLRLSLIKSATMPDATADQGQHRFTYALMPHTGGWRNGVAEAGYRLNHDLAVFPVSGTQEHVPVAPLVSCNTPGIIVETIKPAEDGNGFIVRLFDHARTRGVAQVSFGRKVSRVKRCNILEEPLAPVHTDGHAIAIPFKPYEIISLRCHFDPEAQ
ncbi:MAG: glycoside hydrolase family 38 C-terminal domain-containing protein [Pseudomonadota bacterium]